MTDNDEAPPTATVMEVSTTYSQVVFIEVPKSYPPNTAVKCTYSVTSALQTHRRDWVGIFKVGWSSTREYYTFVWTNSTPDSKNNEIGPYVIFDAYYLPKEDGEFYQFCYVDSNGQVRGASTPFCFKIQSENSIDYSFDSDLLVITTQEQVEQVEKEKEELQKEMEGQRETTQILKAELDERLLEMRRLRESNEELSKKVHMLQQQLTKNDTERELEQNRCAQQTETKKVVIQQEQLVQSEALECLQRKQEELQQTVVALKEKNEKANININYLKTEREALTGRAEAKENEITLLKLRMGELVQEGQQHKEKQCRLQDQIQLLQVDLQSSQKENVKLSGELRQLRAQEEQMKGLQCENQMLRRSLSNQEQQGEVQAQCSILAHQLQGTKEELVQEKQMKEDARKRAELIQQELQDARVRLERGAAVISDKEQMNSKLESLLLVTRRALEEQACLVEITHSEKEELCRENQKLRNDIQRLREEIQQTHVAPSSPATISLQNANPYSPSPVSPVTQEPDVSSLLYGNPFQAADSSNPEAERVCRYCSEVFPGISQVELEQHEHSHRVCPFCTLICDDLEQASFEDHVYNHED